MRTPIGGALQLRFLENSIYLLALEGGPSGCSGGLSFLKSIGLTKRDPEYKLFPNMP